MKSFILKWIAALAILIPSAALCAVNPRGLVLYTEPPTTYVESVEYFSLTETSVAFATVVLPSGRKQEIARNGIVAVIPYPPEDPTESLPEDAAAAMQSIKACQAKYPQFAAKLDAVQTRWTNSLEFYRQRQRQTKSAPAHSGSTLTLVVDGATYTHVVLTAFDGATVGIEHAAGVAGIHAMKLNPEQIAALNATSSTVRIDPVKIVAATPAPPPAPPQLIAPRPAVKHVANPPTAASVLNDEFVEPENLVPRGGPSYVETLDFINGKIAAYGCSIGFGKNTQKMIFRREYSGGTRFAAVFDPQNLTAGVRHDELSYDSGTTDYRVILQGYNGATEFLDYQTDQAGNRPTKITASKEKDLVIHVHDHLDAERIAKAFSQLIYMFGGRAEAF